MQLGNLLYLLLLASKRQILRCTQIECVALFVVIADCMDSILTVQLATHNQLAKDLYADGVCVHVLMRQLRLRAHLKLRLFLYFFSSCSPDLCSITKYFVELKRFHCIDFSPPQSHKSRLSFASSCIFDYVNLLKNSHHIQSERTLCFIESCGQVTHAWQNKRERGREVS